MGHLKGGLETKILNPHIIYLQQMWIYKHYIYSLGQVNSLNVSGKQGI